jgi:hypothetical protein
MEFEINEDLDFIHRKKQHDIWHKKAGIQKRNTTVGTPKYIKVSEYKKRNLY